MDSGICATKLQQSQPEEQFLPQSTGSICQRTVANKLMDLDQNKIMVLVEDTSCIRETGQNVLSKGRTQRKLELICSM